MISEFCLYLIHTMLMFSYRKEYRRFKKADNMHKIYEAQKKLLKEILSRNRDTMYGKKYNFNGIKDINDFQKNVPVTSYEDYIPYIEKIKMGKENILTRDKVRMFEITSGSSSPSKLIPYTDSLKKEFQKGIKPWLYSLYKKYPDLKQGKSYWSITPSSSSFSFEDNKKTPIPMGFEEDSEYFGKIQKYMMNFIFVNLDRIQEEKDMNIFYLKTVSSLLNCENLRLISIWSPSFLFLLLEYMETNQEKVLKKVKNKKRREKLKKYISEKDYKSIWKNLRVISCWGENSSSGYIKKIRNLFPFTVVQEKGLLATESFISFPFIDDYNTDEHNDDYNNISLDSFGSRLSHNSHFFEFICTETGNICDISQIKKGKDYEILVTTGGGFYRYSLGDIIRVISMKGSIPYIKFIGRKGNISDLFGEKLNEIFLKEMMDFYYKDKIEYYMFAPDKERYVLYLKSKIKIKEEEIDKRLKENFHYDYCRKLGQLKPLKIFILTGNPEKEYINFCLEKGQKLGNIKIKVLSSEKGWDKIYTGYFQKEDDRE